MKYTTKIFGSWKDMISFPIGLASCFFYFLVISGVFSSLGFDMSLWILVIFEAAWLFCAVGFLFGSASWWEQKNSLQTPSIAAKLGCILSGGFLITPILSYLYIIIFRN
jgi:hypothetical protein